MLNPACQARIHSCDFIAHIELKCYIGKSTYLRQVGLLAVSAMCGCFVAAEYASFRYVHYDDVSAPCKFNDIVSIHDALLTRLSNDDDMERSLSTFASEMATSAMIIGASPIIFGIRVDGGVLGLATSNTLVLIDELGRGTSPREGVGISHAIAEALIEQKVGQHVPGSKHTEVEAFRLSCFLLRTCNNTFCISVR